PAGFAGSPLLRSAAAARASRAPGPARRPASRPRGPWAAAACRPPCAARSRRAAAPARWDPGARTPTGAGRPAARPSSSDLIPVARTSSVPLTVRRRHDSFELFRRDMPHPSRVRAACSACLFAALAAAAAAQTVTGTVQGTVTDPSGGVLPGATVVIRSPETGLARTLSTTEKGFYSAPFLPIGRYQVRASR